MKYDKIKTRIKELDLKVQEVAEMINIPFSRLSETIGGKREIQANEILPLSEILKVDPVSLLKYLTNRSDELSFTEGQATSKIPVLGAVEAGIWRESNILQGNGEAIDYPLPSGYDAKYIFALRVDGESMNKVMPNGTYIVCIHIHACLLNSFDALAKGLFLEKDEYFDIQCEYVTQKDKEAEEKCLLKKDH